MVEDDERGGVFDSGKDVFDDGGGVFDGATAVWWSLLTLEDGMSLSEVLIGDGILALVDRVRDCGDACGRSWDFATSGQPNSIGYHFIERLVLVCKPLIKLE